MHLSFPPLFFLLPFPSPPSSTFPLLLPPLPLSSLLPFPSPPFTRTGAEVLKVPMGAQEWAGQLGEGCLWDHKVLHQLVSGNKSTESLALCLQIDRHMKGVVILIKFGLELFHLISFHPTKCEPKTGPSESMQQEKLFSLAIVSYESN